MIRVIATFCLFSTLQISASIAETQHRDPQFIQAREQGVLYWKKKRYLAAERALTKAVAMPEGENDFKTLYFLVLVNEKLLRPAMSLKYSARAAKIADASPSKREDMRDIFNGLSNGYGEIVLRSDLESTINHGTFQLRALTPFLNKQKKRYVSRESQKYRAQPVDLPHTLFLPHGSYNIAGLHIDLDSKTTGTELAIFLDPPPLVPEPAIQVESRGRRDNRMWWIAGGVTATVAAGLATFFLLSESGAQPSDEFRITVRNNR